ncbi:MAG: GNAT family N-acetyltransferase [Caulobacter sp.]|nr:GNAT family N-acetyltransferase [Caulobacter sp.]
MTARHPLDQPAWNALTSHQAAFAQGEGLARRFAPQYGPLTGVADGSAESLAALAALTPGSDGLWVLAVDPVAAPPGRVVAETAIGAQMVADRPIEPHGDLDWTDLTDADAADMLALATLTRPGPFATQTHQLGRFIGVKQDGVLVAMAGERMRLPGFTEVSGVCTHPDHRGRGYAAALTRVVAARIFARDETPFLHAYASHTATIALYETLGFAVRRRMTVTVLAKAG